VAGGASTCCTDHDAQPELMVPLDPKERTLIRNGFFRVLPARQDGFLPHTILSSGRREREAEGSMYIVDGWACCHRARTRATVQCSVGFFSD
jgi:hypothetical protein